MTPIPAAPTGIAGLVAALAGGGSPRLRLLCTMFIFTAWLLERGYGAGTAVLVTAVLGLAGCLLAERMFPAEGDAARPAKLLDFTLGVRL